MRNHEMLLQRIRNLRKKAGKLNNSEQNEAKIIVEELAESTIKLYDYACNTYAEKRTNVPCPMDIEFFDLLLQEARTRKESGLLGDENGIIKLLDVGTGHGRDLLYFSKFEDIRSIGIDNSRGFAAALSELQTMNKIPADSFYIMDMLDLGQFNKYSFDIVRHNATILHLPVISPNLGAEFALKESNRILKIGGLLFLLLKEGQGVHFVDTKEGLGPRFFQYFDEPLLNRILPVSGYKILFTKKMKEQREEIVISWIAVYAEKLIDCD
jgi:SAM-dependent methyltransferase